MTYIDKILDKKNKIDSIYDMVALCYDLLTDEICDEELFVGEYIVKNEQANENNPNIERLICFQEKVCYELKHSMGDMDNCFDLLINLLNKVTEEIQPYGAEEINILTPLYFIILAIDRYSEKINKCQYSNAPLNCCYFNKSYVYFKPCNSLIDDAARELNFSKYISDSSICSYLNNINLVKKDIYANNRTATKVVRLYLEENDYPSCIIEKKINIVIIPFNGFNITNISKEKGALFTIKYSNDYGEKYSKRAIFLLDKAISEGANIIVFPEYICSDEIQCNIGKHLRYLREKSPDKVKQLLFVLAGTGWINGNNVSKVYDKGGDLIGSHYKMTKYRNQELIEDLRSPGKESLAIDVKGVGRFMPAICRDISYTNDMYPLFNAFRPFEILIPAWSSSVNIGFNSQCCHLAEKYCISSVLCNSCEPLIGEPFKIENNLIVTPFKNIRKKRTYIEGKVKKVCRKQNCDCECSKKSCLFLITMDYSTKNVRDGNIVIRCKQKITEID